MDIKKIFFDICYVSTIVTIAAFVIPSILVDLGVLKDVLSSDIAIVIRGVALLFLLILWIKCIIVWSKKDKNVLRFFLLFFLHGLYMLYYYPKIIKNNWL